MEEVQNFMQQNQEIVMKDSYNQMPKIQEEQCTNSIDSNSKNFQQDNSDIQKNLAFIQDNTENIANQETSSLEFQKKFNYKSPVQNKSQYSKKNQNENEDYPHQASSCKSLKTNQHNSHLNSGSTQKNKVIKTVIEVSYTCSKKNIEEFPTNYSFQPLNLQILDLTFNKFKEIPEQIFEFKNLNTLRLDSNFIREIPSQLFEDINLQILTVSNNLIYYIPENINKQNKLIQLDLSINRLDQINPNGICQLKQLKSLKINNNEFRYLPYEMENLSNLLEIQLDWFKYCQPQMNQQMTDKIILQEFVYMFQTLRLQKDLEQDPLLKFNNQEINLENMDQIAELKQNGVTFIEFVTYFSKQMFQINQKYHHGRTLAHLASLDEDTGALISILEYNYELINSLDYDENTPLSLAILQEKYFSSKTLIQNGAKVNLGGGLYGSCLNITTIKQNFYLIQDLLKRGANANQTDNEGNAPLHYLMTIYHRNYKMSEKICQLLLHYGANPNLKNDEGFTPIHLAAKKGQVEAIKFVLRYNNNIAYHDHTVIPFNLTKKGGNEKYTPLQLACYHGYIELVELFLENNPPQDLFQKTIQGHQASDLCRRDTIISKLLQKEEQKYITKNILDRETTAPNPYLQKKQNIFEKNNQTEKSHQNSELSFSNIPEDFGIQNPQNNNNKLINAQQISPVKTKNQLLSHQISSFNQNKQKNQINSQFSIFQNTYAKNYSQNQSIEVTMIDDSQIEDDEDLDENKEIQEIVQNQHNLVNRQLTYVPNNIQQIEQFYQKKQFQDNKFLKHQSFNPKNSDSKFSHQYISQIKHLISKTTNVIDYYKSSLQKFSEGISSHLQPFHEKMKYLIIMIKLHLEFEQMINIVTLEKNRIMQHNLNLCDDELLLDNLSHNLIMDQFVEVIQKVKDEKTIEFEIIKEIIFYLFGYYNHCPALEPMRKQLSNLSTNISYEAMQSISNIKIELYKQNKDDSNERAYIKQYQQQNIKLKTQQFTIPIMSETTQQNQTLYYDDLKESKKIFNNKLQDLQQKQTKKQNLNQSQSTTLFNKKPLLNFNSKYEISSKPHNINKSQQNFNIIQNNSNSNSQKKATFFSDSQNAQQIQTTAFDDLQQDIQQQKYKQINTKNNNNINNNNSNQIQNSKKDINQIIINNNNNGNKQNLNQEKNKHNMQQIKEDDENIDTDDFGLQKEFYNLELGKNKNL
ncbi:Ankyrin repeat-containing domain [Pseudocohnilembus persalinus]|uniref:Ankyrin repeat-containing domain n=1 Tax=Pseudocohnilembus persalinus TaxID=266149 RepID=A0A0V0QUD2_PSEPJ|nr:Ankyrin repeat-containing domain [Pseudocohnilembus persalinus]|eukprot:KRX05560.1 Ankyrin repeat-containing domain [Pseudocohnilembus persalinus]